MLHLSSLVVVQAPLAIGMPGGMEWLVIAVIGLLIFGKRLPEVGKSLGQGIVQFKKGLKGVEDDIAQVDQPAPIAPARQQPTLPTENKTTVQQFDPYTGKPIAQASEQQHASSHT
jgi:sec-independent protein translocase protein TatA